MTQNKQQPVRVALFLYNMGGPTTTKDVEPFLTQLFQDNDLLDMPFPGLLQNFVADKIIKKRAGDVAKKYEEIGGGSPQLKITQQLSLALHQHLQNANSAKHEFVHVGPLMRYTSPRSVECLELATNAGAQEIWLLTQYPHCARATTGTSLRDFALTMRNNPKFQGIKVRNFARYGNDHRFHDLWAKRLQSEWDALTPGKRHLIVTAHNLPLSYVAEGDPYKKQIWETASQTLKRLWAQGETAGTAEGCGQGLTESADWTLAWQSAVGPVKWMTPDTRDIIKKAAASGKSQLLMWPIAFVSDHIETLHEIDIEFAEIAHAEGVDVFRRVKNLNSDDDFVSYLSHMVLAASRELEQKGESLLLRDLQKHPSGEGCQNQPGGCLCGRYFSSGAAGMERGVQKTRMNPSILNMR